MKITAQQLRNIIREEVELAEINEEIREARKTRVNETSHRRGMMLEGHNRITPEEMTAWMNGDWGYVSGLNEEKFYDDQNEWAANLYDDNRTIGELLESYHTMSSEAAEDGSGPSGSSFGFEGDILNDYRDLRIADVKSLNERVDELVEELKFLASVIQKSIDKRRPVSNI